VEKSCAFLDSLEQKIADRPLEDESLYTQIAHEGWYIRIPLKELNAIRAANATLSLLSPYSFLYLQYRKKKDEAALWGVVLRDRLFLATFKESRPIFVESFTISSPHEVASVIEEFIRRFYSSPKSYFIERVELYYENGDFYEDPEIHERLMLPVEFHRIDCKKLEGDKELQNYLIAPHKKGAVVTIGISKYFVLAVGVGVLLFLLGYDLYLRYSISRYKEEIKSLINAQVELANENNRYRSEILKIEALKPIIGSILENNDFLAQKLRDLFDLVPNDTYLTRFLLEQNALLIEGVTLNKESFLEDLHKKLAAFYQKSSYSIEKIDGGYRFKAAYKEVQQ